MPFLKKLHEPIKDSYEEELHTRVTEANERLDSLLANSPKPPYDMNVIEAITTISKCAVYPELFPEVEKISKTLRGKFKGIKGVTAATALDFQMAIGSLALEYNKKLEAELTQELKSRDMDFNEFMAQAFPFCPQTSPSSRI